MSAPLHTHKMLIHKRVVVKEASVCVCLCVLQGKVHLELRLSEVITDSGVINHKLATR